MRDLDLVTELLRAENTLSLSTVAPDGSPRVAPLFYFAPEDLTLYWLSSPSSGHSHDLERDPSAAVAIFHPTDRWEDIRGVQMRGRVTVVNDPAQRHKIIETYASRFHLGTQFGELISGSSLYCFEPSWLRYVDNSKGFGYKFEWGGE